MAICLSCKLCCCPVTEGATETVCNYHILQFPCLFVDQDNAAIGWGSLYEYIMQTTIHDWLRMGARKTIEEAMEGQSNYALSPWEPFLPLLLGHAFVCDPIRQEIWALSSSRNKVVNINQITGSVYGALWLSYSSWADLQIALDSFSTLSPVNSSIFPC